MTCQRLASILDAYLDGEVDAPAARDIDWHLTECPHCRQQLTARRELQQALHARLPYYRAPAGVRQSLSSQSEPSRAPGYWRRAALALAACLFIVLGALVFTLLSRPALAPRESSTSFSELVASIHVRSLQGLDAQSPETMSAGSHLLDVVSSDQHTVKPWFAGRLPFAPVVQDLTPAGFPLLGGRLEMVLDHPAAALVFRRNRHLINLLMWPATGETSAADAVPQSQTTAAGFHELHWSQSGMTFWAISDVEFAELERFALAWNNPTLVVPASRTDR